MTLAESFDEHWVADPSTGCWNWLRGKQSHGYGCLCVNYKMIKAHRFSYEQKVGPIPAGLQVLHRCDNPGCVNPEHLFLGSHSDNMRDKASKGRVRVPLGEKSHLSKLVATDAERIRDIYRNGGITQRELARYFDTHQSNVSLIVRGSTWARA